LDNINCFLHVHTIVHQRHKKCNFLCRLITNMYRNSSKCTTCAGNKIFQCQKEYLHISKAIQKEQYKQYVHNAYIHNALLQIDKLPNLEVYRFPFSCPFNNKLLKELMCPTETTYAYAHPNFFNGHYAK
jgi:hypothetical protein